MALFVTYLIDTKRPPATIRTYASGMKSVLADDGVVIDSNSLALATILKACKYVDRETTFTCPPIQKSLLDLILGKITGYFNGT